MFSNDGPQSGLLDGENSPKRLSNRTVAHAFESQPDGHKPEGMVEESVSAIQS